MSSLSGVLPVDKPAGPTSHDIVSRARKALGIRRIGHTGTLDPFASGLLLLCLGPATRLAEYLTSLPKSYHATMRLGVTTETDDSEGAVTRTDERGRAITREALQAALAAQQGEILQVPPDYSAKRVGGERMYDVARRGGTVSLPPVPVHIHSIELGRFDPPDAEFDLRCSSGTYIRAIARDVGEALGVGAHLTQLRRTEIGRFDVVDAVSFEELATETARARLLSPADAVSHLPSCVLDEQETAALRHGRAIRRPDLPEAGAISMLDPNGALLAIGEGAGGVVQPRKVFL